MLEELTLAYAETYANKRIEFATSLTTATVMGSADLIAQMLDKLVENAVQFSLEGGTGVEISLREVAADFEISVSNTGPLLPAAMQDSIFNSMISVRENVPNTGTHLGLGLYIVRLIAEHHLGDVKARNLDDLSGVIFSVSIPAETH